MAAKRIVSCAPVDRDSDPKAAEAAKFPVEHVVKTPAYGFDTYVERAVWSAVAARRGIMVAEWDGRINDLMFRNADPRRFFRCPGFRDVWDRTLPWCCEQVPMRVVDANQRWETDCDGKPITLKADFSGSDLNSKINTNDMTNTLSGDPQLNPDDEGMCLALVCYSQFDPETEPRVVGKRPVDQPYSYCPSCDHRNAPEVAGLACPDCAKDPGKMSELQLAQSEDFIADMPKYPKGRVFEVVFPYQGICVERGPWPTGPNGETLRMPPYMEIRRAEHPTEDCGLSDTAVDAPMQSLSNQLMERIRKQVQGPATLISIFGIPEDQDGNPWTLSDDPIQTAFFGDQASKIMATQLADVSPALFNAVNMVQQQFRADLGTFELSANSPQDLKGVAVGTVDQAAKSGIVPTDHLIKRVSNSLSIFYGVISDWLRIGWTEGTWVRFQGQLGSASYQLVTGADIPNADFIFTDGDEKSFADAKEFQGAMQWYATGQPPGSPALRRALAAAGIAPVSQELVDAIDEADAQAAEAQAEAMQNAPPPGGGQGPDAGGGGMPGMTPPGPEAGNPAGGGAPPPFAAMMGARG